MKKKKAFPKKTALLLAAAAVLLAGSGIGSARAALTYYSDNYTTQISTQDIGVTLMENGEEISSRDYNGSTWDTTTGELLTYMSAEDFDFAPGATYDEALKVKNSGSIDSYVRVIITKSWQDADGNKDTSLDPAWIELGLTNDGWVVDKEQSTNERTVLYYTSLLPAGSETSALSDTIRVNEAIAQSVTRVQVNETTYKYVYDYNGYQFTLDAEVDAVQTHNAKDAIKSAWGVDVSIGSDGSLSLQ